MPDNNLNSLGSASTGRSVSRFGAMERMSGAPGTCLALARRVTLRRAAAALVACASALGCASVAERKNTRALSAADRTLKPVPVNEPAEPAMDRAAVDFDGSLVDYVSFAMKQSPGLRAAFEEWKAASERIPQARRLPEPVFMYGYFIKSIQTRVGPQRQRFGVQQAFPWPTKLSAAVDAAALQAESAGKRFEAAALNIARRVAVAYWKVWVIESSQRVYGEQLEIVMGLAEVVRGRLTVGKATLADLGQVDLLVSRLADRIAGLEERRRAAAAVLLATIGAPGGASRPNVPELSEQAPPLLEISESSATLAKDVAANPSIRALALMAEAKQQTERSVSAERLPSFSLGFDYIEVGPATAGGMANVPDSGQDAMIAMLGVQLPIWIGIYDAKEAEARAQSRAFNARAEEATNRALGRFESERSKLDDATRRVALYEATLIPQAETVYSSVLGSYQSGQSGIASMLIAQRELLELQLGLINALGDHATAWATLEELVGRPIQSTEQQ